MIFGFILLTTCSLSFAKDVVQYGKQTYCHYCSSLTELTRCVAEKYDENKRDACDSEVLIAIDKGAPLEEIVKATKRGKAEYIRRNLTYDKLLEMIK